MNTDESYLEVNLGTLEELEGGILADLFKAALDELGKPSENASLVARFYLVEDEEA